MGLLSLIPPGPFSPLGALSRPLNDIGYGLMKGKTFSEGLAEGADNSQRMVPYRQQEAQRQEEINQIAEQKNQTIQAMLEAGRPDLANMAEAGQMEMAWKAFLDAKQGGGDERFFGNVVPMQNEEGQVVFGQASNMGRWQPMQGAEGMTPAPTTKTQDIGTHIVTFDVYGNELFRTPKENQQAAFDTATGSGLGAANAENIAAAESMASKLPGLQRVVSELGELADKATYTTAGKLWDDVMRETGREPSEAALARAKYIAMVDNQVLPLLRDTFGAAFTVKEGETLRATLGDPNKHPEEKKAVLEAFIAQKMRDVGAMQSRIPGQQAPGGTLSNGIKWSLE